METNRLWKPDKKARSFLNSGNAKERIARLKLDGALTLVDCKYCGREIYLYQTKRGAKMLTMNGSEHVCVNSPRGKYLKAKELNRSTT